MSKVDLDDAQFTPEVIQALVRWRDDAERAKSPLELHLGVDIGGTNTRVAVVNEYERQNRLKRTTSAVAESIQSNQGETYLLLSKFKSSTLLELIEKLRFVGQLFAQIVKCKPASACLAVAGPVTEQGTQVSLTNYIGEKNLKRQDLPSILFPLETTRFINDLASTCQGINALADEGRLNEYFQPLWKNEKYSDNCLEPVNYVVMAMGTGLGCGLLTVSHDGSHDVLSMEMGHATVCPVGPNHPQYAEEQDFLNFLSKRLYEGKHAVEWEDICSGRGLVHCYEWVVQHIPSAEKGLDAATISRRAVGDAADPHAVRALKLHYQYLFRVAQQQCVGLNGKGVLLAGDNQVSNDPFVSSLTAEFQREFLDHTKVSWIDSVPIFRQVKSYNLNLLGCVFVARRLVLLQQSKTPERGVMGGAKKGTMGTVLEQGLPFAAGVLVGSALLALFLKK